MPLTCECVPYHENSYKSGTCFVNYTGVIIFQITEAQSSFQGNVTSFQDKNPISQVTFITCVDIFYIQYHGKQVTRVIYLS